MESSGSGIDRDDYNQEPVRGHGQREDSNAAIPTGAPSSVAAEGRSGAPSPLPPSAPPVGEQGGGGGGDHAESSSAAAGVDQKGKSVAATLSSGSSSNEQGKSPRAKKTFLSKIFNSSKNMVLCRKGTGQSSTGSLSNELSEGPHVNQQKLPFEDAIIHYRLEIQKIHETTGVFATNVLELRKDYSQFRRVEGDGECFYRSFIFSYLEQVLDRRDTHEEHRLLRAVEEVAMQHARLGWTSNFSRSFEAFEELVKKVMSWKARGRLIPVASTNSYRKQKLLNFFSTYDRTENIFVYLRLVAAIWICSDRETYEPKIDELREHRSLQDWCFQKVTTPRAVADHVQIEALATALGVPLRVERLRAGAGQYISSGVSPVRVTLLLTYDHYDIIYPRIPHAESP